jgi:hypothetical protein
MDDEQQRMWAIEKALRYCLDPLDVQHLQAFADELVAYVRKDRVAQPVELHPRDKALHIELHDGWGAWHEAQIAAAGWKGLDDA